jgi:hypothetical protein
MATERQIAANRKNALLSRGPSSRAGIARAARNANRHGLAAAPTAPELRQVEQLANEIAGISAGYARHAIACQAAHAAIDVARARQAKIAILNSAVIAETTEESDPMSTGEHATCRTARALRRVLPDLLKLDRYESRALARRNRALASLRLLNTSEPIDDNGGAPKRGRSPARARHPRNNQSQIERRWRG